MDKVSPDRSLWQHLVQDVLPYIYCCFLPQSDCAAYYRHRPSDNGSRYNPPPPGEKWTFKLVIFNGLV